MDPDFKFEKSDSNSDCNNNNKINGSVIYAIGKQVKFSSVLYHIPK